LKPSITPRPPKVPIIVAVNKIDKPEANPDRVKKQLADRGLIPEEWAGAGSEGTVFVEVSAKKRINLDLLLEMICLVSDIKAPKATPGRKAVGSVLEAKLDRGRGAVATVLVQDGTLRLNESYIVGNTFGKVRAMFDDRGRALDGSRPSTPVEVLGLEGDARCRRHVPGGRRPRQGQGHCAIPQDEGARGAAGQELARVAGRIVGADQAIGRQGPAADHQGRRDGIGGSAGRLAHPHVRRRRCASRCCTRAWAPSPRATCCWRRPRTPSSSASTCAPSARPPNWRKQENVEIRLHSIIYELQDEIRLAMMGLLEPAFKENYLGRAEVLNIFKIPKVGTIAGCRVQDGVIRRDAEVRVMRDGAQVFKGKIGSLKRFKDDAAK
jgi:translation initiation factor IF-2